MNTPATIVVAFVLCAGLAAVARADESAIGTVMAANRDFADVLSGPDAKIYAGTVISPEITGGNLDINFVHRENRKCTWYGKCWYDRWIDHDYYDATRVWPNGIEYRFVSDSNERDVSETLTVTGPGAKLAAPLRSSGAYNTAYRLQARISGNIDPNRTTGAYSLRISVEAGPRIAEFVKFLNNGSFLPQAAEIGPMLQRDTWSRRHASKEDLVRAIVNYAQVVFPTSDSTKSEEHYKLLEVARSIDPNSPQLSRALVNHYTTQGDYAAAGAELRKSIKDKEASLLVATGNRSVRSSLAADYAQLAALAEREGSLASLGDYARADALFARAVDLASQAGARAVKARILGSRARILRKSNNKESLERASASFDDALSLLGKPLSGYVVSAAPNGKAALLAVATPSRGIVFQNINDLRASAALEGKSIENPDVRTNTGLSFLDLSEDGAVLVDDGGIVSWLRMDARGRVDLKAIENVSFEEAQSYKGGVIGWVRNAAGKSSLQYLHGTNGPQPVPREGIDRDNWMLAAASGAAQVLLVKRGATPAFVRVSISADGSAVVTDLGLKIADREVRATAISSDGRRMAMIARHIPSGKHELHVGESDGSNLKVRYNNADPATQFDLGASSGLVMSADGRYALSMTRNRLLSIDVEAPDGTPPYDSSVGGMSGTARIVDKTFGLDNTGSLVAAFTDEEKGVGSVFRLPYDGREFSPSPVVFTVANQYLTDGTPIFLQRGTHTFVGLSRASQNEVFVLDLATSTEVSRAKLPAGDDTQLLTGAKYAIFTDQMTSSAIVSDLGARMRVGFTATSDLKETGIAVDERARLRPRVLAGSMADEWFLAWLDRKSGHVKYISRYIGATKAGSTYALSIDRYPAVRDRAKALAGAIPASATPIGFSFSDASDTSATKGRAMPFLTVTSELSRADLRAKVEALPSAELKAALDVPVLRLTSWPPKETLLPSKLTGRIVAFHEGPKVTVTSEGGTYYVYKPAAAEQMLFPPGSLPGVTGETLISPILFSGGTDDGKGTLTSSALSFMSKKDSNVSLRHIALKEDGSLLPCGPACAGTWVSEKDVSALLGSEGRSGAGDWNLMARFVSTDRSWFAVVDSRSTIFYSWADRTSVIDEIPMAIPYSVDRASGHVALGAGRIASGYRSMRR